jgi:hypothetical protein
VIVTPPPAVTASTSVPPTTRPATPAPVVVTAAANGSTVGVRLGQQVVVTLSSGERWAEPVSGDDAVLHRLSGSADAATGSATATFSAVAAGTAKVTSSRRCLPKPGQVCAQYVALWSVTVVVR